MIDVDALFDEACSLHQRGLLEDSASKCNEVLIAQPQHADAHHLLGIIATQSGDFLRASEHFAKATANNPSRPAFHANLGLALQKLSRFEEALISLGIAIALKPDYAEAYYNRGIVLQRLRQPDDAIAHFDQAILLKPNYFQAYSNRGIALTDLQRNAEAVSSFDRAIAILPNYAEAYCNRGKALHAMGFFEAAVGSCDHAIRLRGNFAEAHFNRGVSLRALGQVTEAIASYDSAIAIKSDYAEAHYNRGNAMKDIKRLDAAIESFDRAIAIDPSNVEANWNKGFTLLLKGDFEQGLRLYEWRWQKKDGRKPRPFGEETRWQGRESLIGKSILVYSEQGLGDTIQFSRYLSLLNQAGADVLFAPQKCLQALMKTLKPGYRLIDEISPNLEFDFHSPLLSLPLAFATDLTNIPGDTPYLSASESRVEQWKTTIGSEGFRIGICWHGSSADVDSGRSFPIRHFKSISNIEGVRLISIQKGEGVAQLANLGSDMNLETLGDAFDAGPDAFIDTAAVMKHCDLVITADTSVGHLAGALGVPVWVVLNYAPDWRWMLDRSDSPWYPTMRLFRQPQAGDWNTPFVEMEQEFRNLLRNAARR